MPPLNDNTNLGEPRYLKTEVMFNRRVERKASPSVLKINQTTETAM